MTKHKLSSRYEPSDIEHRLYDAWLERGYFQVAASEAEDPYVIVMPPPNVTGALHMGHGLNNTLQDVLIRWQRMRGHDVLWLPGTDHAGIATQNVVERELMAEGKERRDLGRQEFVKRAWTWVDEYGSRILDQLKAIGCSCDWDHTRFTLDQGLSRAVREAFVRLYERGLVYRGEYIINWCPRCRTALSNEEVERREQRGKLWHLRYRYADGKGGVTVATTRPETLLGDTAVAVHPDDERYRDLVGREVLLPLVGRLLPVIEDEHVDPAFGSGVVKVTPAHDPADFDMSRRHDLEIVDVLRDDATVSDEAPERFRGLDRFEARKRVVGALEEEGLLVRVEEHEHAVGHCYRCETAVEPRLSLQWFVRMEPLAEPALEAHRRGELRFHPASFGKDYERWLENIRDWCISRQLWWGHQIPVWYCRSEDCGREEIVARDAPVTCPDCGGEVEQDPDVLDTWFSSWLWPFATLGWPEETPDLEAFYPTNTLVTGSDILFFWVARMVMAGLEFLDELPFCNVLINGMVKDHLGRNMSKSLGNGIDPLEVVERFGADALRYTLISGSAMGSDIRLNYWDLEEAFQVGRNFANKIWNAARFCLEYLEPEDLGAPPEERELELADRWILSRYRLTARQVTERLESYRLHEAAQGVYHFVWDEFCDWYLELVKPRLHGERGEASRRAAATTLAHVMDGWLRLLHPVMPFITEELALRMPGAGNRETILTGPWPDPPAKWRDPAAEEAVGQLQELIGAVRNLRSEYNVHPGRKLDVHLRFGTEPLRNALADAEAAARHLAGIETVWESNNERRRKPGAHVVLSSGTEVFVPLGDVIDLKHERERLANEIERLEEVLASTRAKLDEATFLEKAPFKIVERMRGKKRSVAEQLDRLREKRSELEE